MGLLLEESRRDLSDQVDKVMLQNKAFGTRFSDITAHLLNPMGCSSLGLDNGGFQERLAEAYFRNRSALIRYLHLIEEYPEAAATEFTQSGHADLWNYCFNHAKEEGSTRPHLLYVDKLLEMYAKSQEKAA